MTATLKKRGRPKKVFSKDPEVDARLHLPSHSWDFTDHSLFDDDGNIVQDRLSEWQKLSGDDYSTKIKIAREQAPDTGKWHGQGRIVMKRKYRFEAIKKIIAGPHIEVTLCTIDWAYFAKFGTELVLDVDNRHQGKRVIFADQAKAITDGATLLECSGMEGANYQSLRSAQLLMEIREPCRPISPRTVSRISTDTEVPTDPDVYHLADDRFWNGYDAHKSVYVDLPLLNLSDLRVRRLCGQAPMRVGRYGRQYRSNHVYLRCSQEAFDRIFPPTSAGRFGFLPPHLCARK